MNWHQSPVVDQVGIEERVARFNTRSIKKESKMQGLHLALNMIDLTTLEGKDTVGKVTQMCYKAQHVADHLMDVPTVAAVCVYPNHVKTAKKCLLNSSIKIASVATAFPSGNSSLKIKLEACKHARLKVILETGELSTLDNVRKASDIAILAGADFIKTSTGKIQPAATMPVTLVMLQAIKDYHDATGKMIGMKPAGGISTSKMALQYLVMLYETLGDAWMSNEEYHQQSALALIIFKIK